MPKPTANQQFTINHRRRNRSNKPIKPGQHQEAVAIRDYLHPQMEIKFAHCTPGRYCLENKNRFGFIIKIPASTLEHARHLQRWYGCGTITKAAR